MSLTITGLTRQQVNEVVAARRSLPIPLIIHAASEARDKVIALNEGRSLLVQATNEATKTCREAEVGAAPSIITFQVASEEYVMAEAVKATIDETDYDVLTFAFRSVLDPGSIPENLASRLHRIKVPQEPAPQPQAGPAATPAGKAARTQKKRKQPAKPATAPSKEEARKEQVDDLQSWLDE